jgi:23S rRNA (guanosine2251-2'-O)-methyltransferase
MIKQVQSLKFRKAVEQQRRQLFEATDAAHGGLREPPYQVAPFMVLIENVRSLWNVGSILRTSDAAGFKKVYLTGITGCPPRKEIAKTSLGAENYVSWHYFADSSVVLSELRQQQVSIIGLEYTEDSQPLSTALNAGRIHTPLCLIVGNEECGIDPQTLQFCDLVCHLPMRGTKTSLNVAVAYGVAAYAIAETISPQAPVLAQEIPL